MATIRSTIQMFDGTTPALRSISNALNITISSFEALQNASSNAIDTSSIQAARAELNRAEMAFEEIEQEIREANEAQQRFNEDVRNGQGAADGLLSKIKSIGAAVGAVFSAKKVIELADSMTSTTARLDLMNDGLQTTKELQEMILHSANASRGAYQTTADAVAKMGILAKDAFSSNAEVIAFVEQLNKQFTISGTSTQGIGAAMLQLTQAMGQGVLRGEELNSVFEQAPTIIQSIADYLDVPIGQIRELAQEGLITSEVVKNAMFATAEETNARFEQMPMTFGQVGTVVGNTLLQTFEPVIQGIGKGAQLIYDNWSTLEPVFWGLVGAAGAYLAISQAQAIWTAINTSGTIAYNVALMAKSIAMGFVALATGNAALMQQALNTAMLASPIGWITLAIGILIAVIYKWVKSVGGIKIAWMIAVDKILTAWDWVKIGFFTGVYWIMDLFNKMQIGFKKVSVNIANFMGDMKANVLMLLQNMVNGAIDIINGFIDVLNKIPGVSIDTIEHVTFGTNAQLENEAAKKARNEELEKYIADKEAAMAERDQKLEQMKADAIAATAERQLEIANAQAEAKEKAEKAAESPLPEFTPYDPGTIEGTGNNGKIEVEMSDEDLKYLRDIAERDYINKFTTATLAPNISIKFGDVRETADADKVAKRIRKILQEEIAVAAEGSYA